MAWRSPATVGRHGRSPVPTSQRAAGPGEVAGGEAIISGDARFGGSWRLLGMSVRQPNREVTRPMGGHPRGLLMYTAGGHMSVQIMAGDRPLFGASGRGGSIEEAADAFRT